MTTDCLFCRIIAGEIPSETVAETAAAIAIRDINPQAPTHVLVIPREHYRDVFDLADADAGVLAALIDLADQVAEDECEGEYRLVFNTGPSAGQSVFHVHGHVLGGKQLGWSPG